MTPERFLLLNDRDLRYITEKPGLFLNVIASFLFIFATVLGGSNLLRRLRCRKKIYARVTGWHRSAENIPAEIVFGRYLSSSVWTPTFVFKYEGKEYIAESSYGYSKKRYKIGEEAEIYVNFKDPEYVFDPRVGNIYLIMGGVGLAIGIILIFIAHFVFA